MKNLSKIYDYFILSARFLIAWTFLSYGWGKITDGQFVIDPLLKTKPLNEVGLFKLSWYLFDQQPFKYFIGISQIVAGLLLLYHGTLIFGALLSIPILANILIIDITYIKMSGLYWRLSYYLFLDFLILWHYKEQIFEAVKLFSSEISTKFKYPIWAYFILPIAAILLELLIVIPKLISGFIFSPTETWNLVMSIPSTILQLIHRIFH